MAAGSRVNTGPSPHSRLRSVNNALLRSLQENQEKVRSILNDMSYKPKDYTRSFSADSSFTVRGLDRTPVAVRKIDSMAAYSKTSSSTPKSFKDALRETGNDRRNRKDLGLDKTPSASILLTPANRAKKTPKKGLRVSFQTSFDKERDNIDDDLNRRSLLGYDWIAGILDNESYLAEKHDDFFDDLKEFRRVNKQDCFSQALPDSLLTPYRTTPRKINEEFEEEKEVYTCANTYRLNERLFAERVHEPDVACSVCKSQPKPEYESEGSYVRVSVPRSTLQSPYKIKPHRRVSFDPTDTIGLSSHCLAGWESSKPAVVPPQSSLDLKASLHHSRATLDASRIGRFSPPSQHSTQELLEHSALMRYGLQVLDKERGPSTRPHTTPYPAY
ncbi:migration and invasion-inhibitory protein [Nematostella vectensis]|uniref:migration and invasion-inhibitory protein n=1 Tax=Nematostella vectensis TaxID=45351 RepID=UPI0020777F08|nr:migration and invasion-inhibitory protein [Nematostella vectensis]